MAALYEGVDVWIADCLTRSRTRHTCIWTAFSDGRVNCASAKLYLTHMGNGLDYRTLAAELPGWAAPAYDGLEIALS